jgi:hypothetical protein
MPKCGAARLAGRFIPLPDPSDTNRSPDNTSNTESYFSTLQQHPYFIPATLPQFDRTS